MSKQLDDALEDYRDKAQVAVQANQVVADLQSALREAEIQADIADRAARRSERMLLEIAASRN